MFPQRKRPDRAMTKMDAYLLLRRAEALASVSHAWIAARCTPTGGSGRKHLPDVDVARGGGSGTSRR